MKRLLAPLFAAFLAFDPLGAFAAAPAIPPSPPTASVYNWTDAGGDLRTSSESVTPAYDADTELFTPASSPTDVFAIYSNNQFGPTVYVKRVEVSCVSTAAAGVTVRLQWTSGSNLTTGTYTSLTTGNGYVMRRDLNSPLPSAAAQYWTANPTARNGISSTRFIIDSREMLCSTGSVTSNLATTTAQGTPAVFDLTNARTQTGVLNYGPNYTYSVNLGGATMPSGFAVRVKVTWEEVKKLSTCMVGDSTTANATLGYLNGSSSYQGGLGKLGSLNGIANVYNIGSNGFRLSDYLNNINSPTWPLGMVQASAAGNPATTSALQTGNYFQQCDIVVFTYGINDVRTGLMGVDIASMTNRLESLIDTAIQSIVNGTTIGSAYTSPVATSYGVNAASVSAGSATFTGSQTGTTLTTSSVTGTIYPGATVSGSGASETIVQQLTGTTGGAGTYSVSVSQTASPTTATYANVTFTATAAHQFQYTSGAENYGSGGVAVTISGASNSAYNGTFPLQGTGGATTFTVTLGANPGTFSGSASEQFATIWYGSYSAMPLAKVILYSPNSFTTDDFGSGAPLCYLDINGNGSGSSCTGGFSSLWTNAGYTTLAQIAQAASSVLYNAYAYFGTDNSGGLDSRVFALVHKQSAGGGSFPSTVIAGNGGANALMQNQIHPGSYGQYLEAQQIAPYIIQAAQKLLANRY